ncbi:DnaJ C-terminal domain-containing protein [Magnetospirillum molischianum]|uniref:Chaperone DnaJ domain protein n=1 Tax=Magnetospirillum molischianum DSM 120 TaxID=1150626 RepID=H8FQ41_MAGML|nr:DnaJ C-terminal domain-containing protein [Magnetospirillum molischianum]CCG40479.1 Chaperone DnaJ domain protein [Magnetospirillum molischianum DSM 120]
MDDPYTILGVPRDASADDIRTAYRALAKRHHPDLNPGNAKAEERFKAVASANELLSDPIKRGQFDRGEIDAAGQQRAPRSSYRDYAEGASGHRYGSGGAQSEGWSAEDFSTIFSSIFNEDRHPGGNSPTLGRDELYSLSTSFLEAINGTTRRLTLPDGRVLDVKIPPGTAEGHVLRLRGQGGKGTNGSPAGDALIEVHVSPHRFFERDGDDIRLILPVTLAEAVLGGPVEVPTPGGQVRMNIPPHSDNGTELRLRGRGVPGQGGKPAGDLYATLRVVLGPPDAALEDFLRTWKPEHPVVPRQKMEAGQ